MPETTNKPSRSDKPKKPIQILRARLGGVPRSVIDWNKEQVAKRRQITKALEAGPKTVPALAEETGLSTQEVFWYLMGMKKYGTLAEGEECDGYFEYALIRPSQESESTP